MWKHTSAFMASADIVNQPHEDWPNRVRDTYSMILHAYDVFRRTFRSSGGSILITKDLLKYVHAFVMPELESRGSFRNMNVSINLDRGSNYWEIEERLARITVPIDSIESLKTWYKTFQEIHPFEDGNGRVGGVIVVAASSLLLPNRGVLVPTQ